MCGGTDLVETVYNQRAEFTGPKASKNAEEAGKALGWMKPKRVVASLRASRATQVARRPGCLSAVLGSSGTAVQDLSEAVGAVNGALGDCNQGPSCCSSSNELGRKSRGRYRNFPAIFGGLLVFALTDNINTNRIYPGKYTYKDSIWLEGQTAVVMENYDRLFAETAREFYRSPSTGTLPPPAQQSRKTGTGAELVIGPNFSTGLSREKAATALRNAGIRLVIQLQPVLARSFNRTQSITVERQ
ncbi:hypothetical protein PTTG_29194 [Puccinia triticina 1-1 BBBD Race 1]|uniref:Aconitase_C domain-containing protein n=1 Tax=Puccinia triticina (isolate 1-1 / race 1 (BBBD)) TaxID=630390 RepID=A0A180G5Y7_PUCT1|nr:hypothetical protein PTTG_29194 [Puccinia triticina 1-1 BBBD Race 1]